MAEPTKADLEAKLAERDAEIADLTAKADAEIADLKAQLEQQPPPPQPTPVPVLGPATADLPASSATAPSTWRTSGMSGCSAPLARPPPGCLPIRRAGGAAPVGTCPTSAPGAAVAVVPT